MNHPKAQSLVHSKGCIRVGALTLRGEAVEDAATELMNSEKRLRLILDKSPKLLHTLYRRIDLDSIRDGGDIHRFGYSMVASSGIQKGNL